MGAKTEKVGGGAARGVAKDFLAFLKGGLNSGRFSSSNQPGTTLEDPIGKTTDIGTAIDRALAGGFGTDDYSKSLIKTANDQKELGVGELLNRFGMSGNRYSSGAELGVGEYISKVDNDLVTSLGQLQNQRAELANNTSLNALNSLFSAYGMAVGKGIPQREVLVKPGALDAVAGIAGAGAGIFKTFKGK